MAFKELVSPTLKKLFISQVEEMILSGELEIGEKLPPERELAEKMKVSQTVVNGGIIELTNKGFLDVIPRKGTYVADYKRKGKIEILQSILAYNGGHFDPKMMNSLLEIRESLERNEVIAAAQNASLEDTAKLRKLLKEILGTNDPKDQSKIITEFYYELTTITGNIIHPLIFSSFQPIYLSIQELLYKNNFLNIELDILYKMIDLIEQKKGQEAADCLSEIIMKVRTFMNEHFTPGQKLA